MSKRFIITLATLIVIGLIAAGAVFLAKGYTFSPSQRKILGTGIITVTSVPDAASVYIDGHLTTATNATIASLAPKEYTVKVQKEGLIPWEKKVTVREGLVTGLKITLFPAIPTIYPLTVTGVKNPVLSSDEAKLSFILPSGKKAGIWVWTMSNNQPLSLARNSEPHQVVNSTASGIDFSNASLSWSPDSKQILVSLGANFYLLDSDNSNNNPRDITPTVDSTKKTWADETNEKEGAKILSIVDLSSRKLASASASLKWSPDETKFLYSEKAAAKSEKGTDESGMKFKVYDLDSRQQYDIPDANLHVWLPDSRHIILVEKDQISIVDFDGSNKAVIYAGKFEDSFVFAWPDSSRLVMISSFPTPTASEPNLYGINLK